MLRESGLAGERAALPARMAEPTLYFGSFHVPPDVDVLHRGDEVVPLEPLAVRVLRYLAERAGRVIAKGELLDRLWPDAFTTEAVLKQAVFQVRRALGDDANEPRFIETHHRRGYRFITRVAWAIHGDEPLARAEPPRGPNYGQSGGSETELVVLEAGLRRSLSGVGHGHPEGDRFAYDTFRPVRSRHGLVSCWSGCSASASRK